MKKRCEWCDSDAAWRVYAMGKNEWAESEKKTGDFYACDDHLKTAMNKAKILSAPACVTIYETLN